MFRLRRSLAAIVFTGVGLACGGESTGPSPGPLTLNQALAELTIPALAAAGLSLVNISAPAASLDLASCPYSASDQSFVCAPVAGNGITLQPSFTLLSATGVKQSAFDPASTATVRVITGVSGNVAEQGTSLAVVGQQNITLDKLITGPHVLDGWSSITLTGTVADETTTYPVVIRLNSSINQLTLPAGQAGGAQIWPSSGRITADVTGSFGPVSIVQRTTIIFSGTSRAVVSVSAPGGASKGCTVDLAVAQPVCE